MLNPRPWYLHNRLTLAIYLLAWGSVAIIPQLLSTQTAQAQSVLLVPSIVELDTQRGKAEGAFTVNNTSTTAPLRVRLYAEPFTYTDNGLRPDPNGKMDLTPYLVFSPRELTVAPGKSREVRLITRIPENITDKEFRAVVYVQNLSESAPNPNTPQNTVVSKIGVVTRIGATVYARLNNVVPSISVTGVKYDPKQRLILLDVQNRGTASTRPHIEWTLKQDTKEIAQRVEGPTSIVAESSRKFPIVYPNAKDKPLSEGKYNFTGKIIWVDRGWALDSKDKENVLPFNFSLTVPSPEKIVNR